MLYIINTKNMNIVMKDLTIVVPLYNKVHYIQQCLNTIKSSIHEIDWECIVVDDGSTDGSTEVAKEFCNNNHDRFTYVQCLRNHGLYPSYARNMGIRMAESEFIMFFDADDWVCDGYPDRGVKFMKENPDYYHYSESVYIVDKDEDYGSYIEYYSLVPYTGVNDIDFPAFIKFGGGLYTRGIFKTSEVKKIRYKDVLFEDTVFMIDYLYPGKRMRLNKEEYGFYYFNCRSEQDVFALNKVANDDKMTDREYFYNYVATAYPEYYEAYIKPNNNYQIEIKEKC